MTTTKTSLICNKFGGIRRIDARYDNEIITCSDCQNVELFNTGINSGVGIRTAQGNINLTDYFDNKNITVYIYTDDTLTQVATDGEIVNKILSFTISSEEYDGYKRDEEADIEISSVKYYAFSKTVSSTTEIYYTNKTGEDILTPFGEDEEIINIFSSYQDSTEYCLLYTEDETEGKIYSYINGVLTELIDGLTVTGKSCGADFTQGWNDLFMFSNNVEVVKIDMSATTKATELTLTGTESESVTGLGFKVFNSRLWIFKGNRLWYSYKGDCTDFSTVSATLTTSAGYIEFSKNITAIYPYLGSLAVFHNDSSALINNDEEDNFTVSDDSPGGCCGYDALVFHGTDLYFYDDTKKGVFSFQQVVNGDKTLGQNIAVDLQEELLTIDKDKLEEIKALSVVLSDRNEVWFMLPVKNGSSTVLIYDYNHNEWVKRKEQPINCIRVINNQIYSGGEKLYEEYNGNDFDGDFIESYYYATPFNLGSDNALKMLYFPPRLTIDTTNTNDFWVRYIKNYDFFKREKKKHIVAKSLKNVLYWNMGGKWDDGLHYAPLNCTAVIKFPTNTFKTLEMRMYTENSTQGFCIRSIEFSKIKVKTT